MIKSENSRDKKPEKNTLYCDRDGALDKVRGYILEEHSKISVYFPHQGIISFRYNDCANQINPETARFESNPKALTQAEKKLKKTYVPIVKIRLPTQELYELIFAGRNSQTEFSKKAKHLADILNHIVI